MRDKRAEHSAGKCLFPDTCSTGKALTDFNFPADIHYLFIHGTDPAILILRQLDSTLNFIGVKIFAFEFVYNVHSLIDRRKTLRLLTLMAARNTVIAHLLLGIAPKYIREAPYVPSIGQFPLTKAAPLGI